VEEIRYIAWEWYRSPTISRAYRAAAALLEHLAAEQKGEG
jgi:hypothetical protein